MEEVLKQTAQITSHRSFLGVLKVSLASELRIKRKFSYNPALMGLNIYIHSGHIHVSFEFCMYRIAGKFGGELNLAVWWSILQPPN